MIIKAIKGLITASTTALLVVLVSYFGLLIVDALTK